MRIIEICLAKGLGGLELYFEKCCLWFHKSPHYALFLTLKGSRLENRFQIAGLPALNLTTSSKWMSLFNAYKLSNVIENHNIDIVHVHHKDDLLLTALTKLICKKKFLLVHTRQMQIPHSKKDVWHKFIYKKIDLFLTITDQLKEDAIRRIPLEAHKIKKIYYGVKAPENFSKKNCTAFFKDKELKENFKIALFSRIEYLKGQHLVIEAANFLRSSYPDIQYFFIGDIMNNEYYQKLQESVKKHELQDIIVFKGFHPNPLNIMSCFDIVLLPSYNETFGLVLAEAMRAEVAVIGTDFGGIREIIEHNNTGLVFEKDNYKDLALQIELLYNNENLRRTLARNGKEKADKEFNEETHFLNLEELFTNERGS